MHGRPWALPLRFLCSRAFWANKRNMNMRETGIALLWDSAPLWSLLVWRAIREMGVPCVPLKPQEIAQGALSDKRLLLVPGGSARQKFAALGVQGRQAVRDFVSGGGRYLGFCGGAGLGLTGEDGLGLCPWRRAEYQDRLPHLLSGHVPVRFSDHAFSPSFSLPRLPEDAILPVWWPGRFQADENDERVTVLARYQMPPGHEYFPPDMLVADLPLGRIPHEVLNDWRKMGVELPPHLHDTPCVVEGRFGEGFYVLSYSHLETPDSPVANAWLAAHIQDLARVEPRSRRVSPWDPTQCFDLWDDPVLITCRNGMRTLLDVGQEHGLLFPRTPWLTGWRAGTPGAALNTLYLALNFLTASSPSPAARALWLAARDVFEAGFTEFLHKAEWCLFTQRLSDTLAASQHGHSLAQETRRARVELFGTAMQGDGLYQMIIDWLEPVLFAVVCEQAATIQGSRL